MKDWGEGIPEYSNDDLMTKQDLHSFGIEIIFNYLNQNDYKIIDVKTDKNYFPSIVAEKSGYRFAIVVLTDVAPTQPKLSQELKELTEEYCIRYDMKGLFASVSIGAADSERFDKSLALKDDAYYANFTGFEEILF